MSHATNNALLTMRQRRLRHLEVQQATKGSDTEFHVADEIAQLRVEIERLMHYSHIYRFNREVSAEQKPTPRRGLIVLVSPEAVSVETRQLTQAAFDALDYHRPALTACWLIATAGERSSLGAAQWLAAYCTHRGITSTIWQIQDPSSFEEVLTTMHVILQGELGAAQLQPNEVIADITGATKPMSIGVLLTCQQKVAIQYMVKAEGAMDSTPLLISASVGAAL